MVDVIASLTRLEKALGVTPSELPEDFSELVQVQEFTGAEFLDFLKKEYNEVNRALTGEARDLHKEYLGELIAVAKMTFSVKGRPNQIRLPVARNFGPMAMRAWRAFQNASVPKNTGNSFSKSEGADEAGEGLVLAEGEIVTRMTPDSLVTALLSALSAADKNAADLVIEEVGDDKADGEPDAVDIELTDASTEAATEAATADSTVATAKAYEPVVEDLSVEAGDLSKRSTWI